MHTWAELYELTIFVAVSTEQQSVSRAGWWSSAQEGKLIPYSFTRDVQLVVDAALLFAAAFIGVTTRVPIGVIVGLELLYLGSCALYVLARLCKRFLLVLVIYVVMIVLNMLLNLTFPGTWGDVGFFLLCLTVPYRFSPAWSLPLVVLCLFALVTTNGSVPVFPVHPPDTGWTLGTSLALAGLLCGVGWSRRAQLLLVLRLHQTQQLLREQTQRAEELAAAGERARIARDIHDVFSHTLSVLSIQVQAARNLRTRDPERLAARLDEMAALIRESTTESRRVVGLLREPLPPSSGQKDLGAHLRVIVTTFAERTGVHCSVEENGSSHPVSLVQERTLELALREMLTNAHRHGAPQTIWVSLRWLDTGIILETRDDGQGTNSAQSDPAGHDEATGHHGLRGMRERAAALGGAVEAGPTSNGGFLVRMALPRDPASQSVAWRGKEL